MSGSQKANALLLNENDNVATALRDLLVGESLYVDGHPEWENIFIAEPIPYAHKVALKNIISDEKITKYGETIGSASRLIQCGTHVHTHNVNSLRGRGDLRSAEKRQPQKQEFFTVPEGKIPPLVDASNVTFKGYLRSNGQAGTRNYVGILSTVVCANDVVSRLVNQSQGCVAFTHQQGCSQTPVDVSKVTEILGNLGCNPNLGAVLLISLGCESVCPEEVAAKISATGKRVEILVIQKEGGAEKTVAKGLELLQEMTDQIQQERVDIPISKLTLGMKCGSSDTTQGIITNPALGKVSDILVAAGCTSIIGETTEFLGAEHIAAKNSRTRFVAQQIIQKVHDMEKRAMSMGCDIRGGQPTRGNIEGGLTTIEEKSLGSLAKAGSAPFSEVCEYGTPPKNTGLIMMDSPGREPELLTGLAAAGCNLIVFTTGRGAPQGFPFIPVLKVTGNPNTWSLMQEHMDFFVGNVLEGKESIDEAAERLFKEVLCVAQGQLSKAEISNYVNSMNIYVTGPVI